MANFVSKLHVHHFGNAAPERRTAVLALHGLTGHGLRWEALARDYLHEYDVVAPDLRGHGASPWTPPWTIEQHVEDLRPLLEHSGRAVVVGHSFGGNLAIHLARACPERVAGLVLLDPALELDSDRMLEFADATLASPDFTDRAEARSDKVNGSWRDVAPILLERELDQHLVDLPNGRVNWRICMPAVIATFGELARPLALPPVGTRTLLVVAKRCDPPYTTHKFRRALETHLGSSLTVVHADTDHMVSHEDPVLTGRLVQSFVAEAQ